MAFYKRNLLIPILLLCFISCRKYVEDVPVQGQRTLVYTDDYRLLMNNTGEEQQAFGLAPALSSDDANITETVLQTRLLSSTIQTAMYTWSKPVYVLDQQDYDWNVLYKGIYIYNTVINGVPASKGGSEDARNVILGEALIHRAFSYFMLCNLYAKQYDASTAATDPGVPVLLDPVLFGDLTRASVTKVYEQIFADIKRAIPLLPLKPEVNFRPAKASAYALLSKALLFTRDFANAKAFADSALAISGELYDYNSAISGSTFKLPTQFNDKQVLLRKLPRSEFTPLQLSASLLSLLGTKDLRYGMFVHPGADFYPAFSGYGFWTRANISTSGDGMAVGLTVNETWLIKAECLARTGKGADALALLNEFRKFRFKPADYTALTAATDQDVLKLVIDERRREFFGTGFRWFDQRRLNKDEIFRQTRTRTLNGITYTLEPDGNGYVFPLAQVLITQNPELTQNPK